MSVIKRWRNGIAMVIGAGVLAALAGAGVVYSGVYNVSAKREHPKPVYYLLHTVLRSSVVTHAKGIRAPNLQDPARIRDGFLLFRSHCVQCHGAPGVAPEPFAFGFRPLPPSLLIPARDWTASQLYWIVKNGARMTAMPAWQYRFDEQQLWDVTAFVKQLPALSPADYRRWDQQIPGDPSQPTLSGDRVALSGNAAAGRRAIDAYLCVTCHRIPGMVGGENTVGPPLAGMATRAYIAGSVQNSPDNMLRWLRDPQQVKPGTAMPNLHIREQDVRDMTAFMYTLNQGG